MSERAEIIHRSPWRGVLYLTGGGAPLLAELLTTAGASATVLEALVPYAAAALNEVLGRTPEQACSDATARAMAMAAFQRARHLADVAAGAGPSRPGGRSHEAPASGPGPLFGLGCTASLATNRSKRGRHRAHVAVQTEFATWAAELGFEGGRDAEERDLVELLWHSLAEALELTLPVAAPAGVSVCRTAAEPAWRDLILGQTLAFATSAHDGRLLMPGAFNPLHHAHARMLEIAERRTALTGAYELSVVNVDKPSLDYTELDRRLGQFEQPVWVTRLPRFVEKARHFRGSHFVVGIDTLIRIVDPAYYGGMPARDAALRELAELGTRFVVFGRTVNDRFLGLADLDLSGPALPAALRDRCIEVPAGEFAEPISSTALRLGRRSD